MNIIQEIESIIANSAKDIGYNEDFSVSFSNKPELCDFQCNGCFALAKKYGKNPFDIANDIVSHIASTKDFEFSVARPAFINIKLTDKKLSKMANEFLQNEMAGIVKNNKSNFVVMDYGGANIAKALHIGHLRSPIIGESLKRLYILLGDRVVSDAHLGDWGLQMGLTELQLYEDGVLDYYFGKTIEEPIITLDMLNVAYPKASARKKVDDRFKAEADEWTRYIQEKREPYFTIYKKIKEVSIAQIKTHYHELGVDFDLWYGESDADKYIDKVLEIVEQKKLTRVSDGAIVVDVAHEDENIPLPKSNPEDVQRYKNPMPPAMLKKYNGGVLYVTTDIATILMRNTELGVADRIEYVVDGRQAMHFQQVFRVSKMSGISPQGQQLMHIGFGTINGKDGKPFKTRDGDTIKLEDIINMLVDKASEKLKENGTPVTRKTALQIGVAALKFGDLSNTVEKDYVFDLDKFMSFEGKTGPYLQYMVARINSILAKVSCEYGKIDINDNDEREILRMILKLNNAYSICYNEKSLVTLCLSAYNLASAFSTFYNNHKVISEQNKDKQASYIQLLKLVKQRLTQALNVIGIEVPDKM